MSLEEKKILIDYFIARYFEKYEECVRASDDRLKEIYETEKNEQAWKQKVISEHSCKSEQKEQFSDSNERRNKDVNEFEGLLETE